MTSIRAEGSGPDVAGSNTGPTAFVRLAAVGWSRRLGLLMRAMRLPLFVGVSMVAAFDVSTATAQLYDPGSDPFYDAPQPSGRRQILVDEEGRRYSVDARGRIVPLQQGRRRPFDDRRQLRPSDRGFNDPFGDPGQDGAILEGRVGEVPPPGVDDGYVRPRRERQPLGSAVPVERAPFPGSDGLGDQGPGGRDIGNYPPEMDGLQRDAALPEADQPQGDVSPGIGLPEAGAPIASPSDTTAPEPRPAPKVAGPKGKNAKVQIAALQVLLDRGGISPGVIDGRTGSNLDKAVAAYEEKFGTVIDATDSKALAEALDASGGPAIVSYTITDTDLAGPYVASIPEDYSRKAQLPGMSYTRVTEMLGERFHMDEDYLKEINPGADFDRPGTVVKVMSVGENIVEPVARIIADKGREQVRAYDEAGRLVAAYPSTIGSSETPSPSGTVEVARIAFNPNYTYNPKINFTQGQNKSILTIPPGPNGPVGTIWIALSKPTYGIHGTPEPSKIGKTNSHGCVRLTNFDAEELAKLVKPGVTVEFID